MNLVPNLKKILKKPAIQQGVVVLVDQGALTLATFVTGVLVARGNSKADYGTYVLSWSLLLMFLSIHRAIVNLPFTVYAPKLHNSELKAYQGSTLVHTVILCAVIVLALLAVYIFTEREIPSNNNSLYSLLPLVVVVVIPYLLREYLRNSLIALLKIWASVGVNLLATLLLLAFVIPLYLGGNLSINITFQLIAIMYALSAAVMLWKHRQNYLIKPEAIIPDFIKGWPIIRWSLIDVLAYAGASQAYPWLLLLLIDNQAVAVFGACFAMASFLAPFLRGSMTYIMPRMAHGYKGNNTDNLIRLLRLSILILLGPFILWLIIGTLFSEEILTLFYGAAYSDFGLLFVLLIIRVAIISASSPLQSALHTMERADINTGSNIIGGIISLGLGYILIKNYGLYGAGIAGIVSATAIAVWRSYFIWKSLRGTHRSNTTPLT